MAASVPPRADHGPPSVESSIEALLLTPAVVLSVVVGTAHTCLYLLIRGVLGLHVVLVLVAAILGAYAGQALGARLGDPLPLGDYSLLWASALSWLGIIIVAVTSTLAPSGRADGRR